MVVIVVLILILTVIVIVIKIITTQPRSVPGYDRGLVGTQGLAP